SANNFDPLLVDHYMSYASQFGSQIDDSSIGRAKEMGVGILLTPVGCGELELLVRSGEISACRVPDPWPRASLASCTSPNGGQEITCDSVVYPLEFALDTP